jgi:lipid II:glycine glycyltransferase (peptidoglycan interpeptide bridge formation enzyme)
MLGAYLGHELLAVGIFADAYSVRTYLHGASSGTHREVMAPYLLHWSAILDAKAKGLMRYDFWGISNTKPAFAGITRFKCGFGGTEVSFPGTFDHCRTYKSRAFYLVYILLRAMNRLFHA